QRSARMKVRLDKALSTAAGLSAELFSNSQVLIPGENASFDLKLTNNGTEAVRVNAIAATLEDRPDKDVPTKQPKQTMLNPGASTKIPITLRVPPQLSVTVPHAKHLYEKNFAGVPLLASAFVELKQTRFTVSTHIIPGASSSADIAEIGPTPVAIRPDEVGVSSAGAGVLPAKLPELKIQLINYRDQRFNGEGLFGLKGEGAPTSRK